MSYHWIYISTVNKIRDLTSGGNILAKKIFLGQMVVFTQTPVSKNVVRESMSQSLGNNVLCDTAITINSII